MWIITASENNCHNNHLKMCSFPFLHWHTSFFYSLVLLHWWRKCHAIKNCKIHHTWDNLYMKARQHNLYTVRSFSWGLFSMGIFLRGSEHGFKTLEKPETKLSVKPPSERSICSKTITIPAVTLVAIDFRFPSCMFDWSLFGNYFTFTALFRKSSGSSEDGIHEFRNLNFSHTRCWKWKSWVLVLAAHVAVQFSAISCKSRHYWNALFLHWSSVMNFK